MCYNILNSKNRAFSKEKKFFGKNIHCFNKFLYYGILNIMGQIMFLYDKQNKELTYGR